MKKMQYIHERLSDVKLRNNLAKVVDDVDALIPQNEEEFEDIQKFGLYPAEECVPLSYYSCYFTQNDNGVN